jgi:multicomponent Na+:H+ antiporter subunit C
MNIETQTALLGYLIYGGAAGLIVIGLYAMVTKRHLIRILLGLSLLEAGVNLSLVAAGFRPNAVAPIFSGAAMLSDTSSTAIAMVDPVPQALILTAIVIGVGVLALALAMTIQVQRAYGSLDTRKLAEHLASDQLVMDETTATETGGSAEGTPASSGGAS